MQITRTASIVPQIVVEDLLRCCEVGRGSPNGFHWESVSVSAAPRHHGFDHTAFTTIEALGILDNLGNYALSHEMNLLQYSRALSLHLRRRRRLRLVPDMYRLGSLHAVKMNKPVLRLISRLFARVTLLAVLSSKADRAPAHRHENQAD